MDIIYILREVKLCNALSISSQLPDARENYSEISGEV
jgi:hypothetical protein